MVSAPPVKHSIDATQASLEELGLKYKGSVMPTKAYNNRSFLHSRAARHIRIMCEYLETQQRLRNEDVLFSILVFGSARALPRDKWNDAKVEAEGLIARGDVAKGKEKLERLKRTEWMCDYYDIVRELCKYISEWSFSEEGRKTISALAQWVPSPVTLDGDSCRDIANDFYHEKDISPLVICTGGAGGMMEAANRGAMDVPKARSMGMGISLPFECGVNPWVSENLAFQFHYFFTRKFWMVYIALGLIVTPGGVGTLDEMFEFLTLKQTGKIKRNIPVVLVGKNFWQKAVNFDHLIDHGVMDREDVENILYTDDPKEAFEFMRKHLVAAEMVSKEHKWVQRFEAENTKKEMAKANKCEAAVGN